MDTTLKMETLCNITINCVLLHDYSHPEGEKKNLNPFFFRPTSIVSSNILSSPNWQRNYKCIIIFYYCLLNCFMISKRNDKSSWAVQKLKTVEAAGDFKVNNSFSILWCLIINSFDVSSKERCGCMI